MKLKKKNLIFIVISMMLITAAAGIYFYKSMFNRTISSPMLNTSNRDEKWISDLKFVKKELPKKHKNLFFSKSKTEFYNQMDSLIGKVSKCNDMEIKGELIKIISSINDSHTRVDIQEDSSYPVSFFQFDDGVYVVDSSLKYKELWGKKLTSVNGYSMTQVQEKIDPFISKDNKAIIKNQFCTLLRSVEMLKIAGITKEDNIVLNFEGYPNSVNVQPIKKSDYKNVKFLSDNTEYNKKFPISKQKQDKNYWFDYIQNSNLLYVKYNSCSNMPNYSFSQFTRDVFNTIDSKKVKTLVIDFSDNGGGNSKLFDNFLDEINKRNSINKKGNLFVIVGRKTFSSAILNSMDLRNSTKAILIGEPTGGKPNHFGEVKVIHLSNTNVNIYYSSNYFKTTDKETDSIYPDVNIPLKASSYFNGKYDFLDYVLDKKISSN
ncbi:peptidase S41 [Clostridium sp. P21]|uniref:Peptidase S41 n=2 Tax=Clostridium muellerianum TaxID=2716538 RepID=A0A7Y0HMT6_9CLOT|nr:peptidase S41 [Clostridium muellerianum]